MRKTKWLKRALLICTSIIASAACAVSFIASARASVIAAENETNFEVALPYILKQGNTGAVASVQIAANSVSKTNALGQTLKGVELSSEQKYELNNSKWYPVNGYSMGYGQYLTLKIDDTIDMSQPVEFIFSPYVIGGTGAQANHRFVMALSDADGEIKPLTESSKNGFNSDGNYIYWEFAKHQQWASQAAPETQGNGPTWYAVSSAGTTATGFKESVDNINGDDNIKNNRMGGGALARAFYGVEYLWGDVDAKYTDPSVNSQQLIKAKIEFTDTQLILTFDHVSEGNIESKGTTDVCTATHDFTNDSAANCTTCFFRQTYNLSDLNFTSESKLNLYFGYYNVHARFANQNYGALPMSLKLYNYKNGEFQKFGVKDGKKNVTITENETLNISNVMDIAYYDGVTAPTATVTYTSSNENVAKIENGKVVPVKGTYGGTTTITATASTGEAASFDVTIDVNTVTFNSQIIAAGESYTVEEGLYTGKSLLIGYKADGALYAVGDTITLTKDIVLEAVTIDFKMLYGASVRLDETASIRFTAIVNTEELSALEQLIGSDKVSYGMTLKPDGIDKTYAIDSKNEGFDTAVYKYDADYTLYSAVMTKIPENNYTTELTATGYIKVVYTDGDIATLSCKIADKKGGDVKESNVRSLADVAKAAYNDRATVADEKYKYEVADGSFSPYMKAQLDELAKYFDKENNL